MKIVRNLVFLILPVVLPAVAADRAVFRLMSKGEPAVTVDRQTFSPVVIKAMDEFIAYMNATQKRTDYTGRAPGEKLWFAVAGDGSSGAADALMAKNGLDRAKLGHDGFLLDRLPDGDCMLCSFSPKGVLNGVYKIYEKAFGAVAARPQDGLDFPEKFKDEKPIALPYWEKPAFRIRGLTLSGTKREHPNENMLSWMSRVCFNDGGASLQGMGEIGRLDDAYGFNRFMGGHAFHQLVPPREYGETHPEYYSLIGGKRVVDHHGSQLALGNPEVIELLAKRLIEFRRQHPEADSLPFGYNDTWKDKANPFGWSEDACDVAMDSPKDVPPADSGLPRSYSTRYVKAANQVAERVCKVFPDAKIQIYAYHFQMIRPPDCTIHPNIVVSFAPLYKCCHHALSDRNCPRNRYMNECLRGWAAKTRNIFFRDYYSSVNCFAPLMPLYEIRDEVRYYRELGLMGMLPESRGDGPNGANRRGFESKARCGADSQYAYHWDSDALHYFTLARLAWNPDEPLDEIVRLFCRNHYGAKVGPLMEKYFLRKDANVRASSHPGEVSPGDDGAVRATAKGKWCYGWNWNMPLGRYAERVFMTDKPSEVEENAMPLLEPLFAARVAATALRNQEVRNRVEADYDLMRRYLLSFGYELKEALTDKPVFMRKGFKDAEAY